jgi:hypothetical protein
MASRDRFGNCATRSGRGNAGTSKSILVPSSADTLPLATTQRLWLTPLLPSQDRLAVFCSHVSCVPCFKEYHISAFCIRAMEISKTGSFAWTGGPPFAVTSHDKPRSMGSPATIENRRRPTHPMQVKENALSGALLKLELRLPELENSINVAASSVPLVLKLP